MNEIWVAVITGVFSLVGVVVACLKTKSDISNELKIAQAVTDTKIEELTREVRTHNGFAEKIPVIQEQIKSINHRIDDLEQFHRHTN